MNLKNLIKDAVVKTATKAVINKEGNVSKGKMTLGALVLGIAGLLFEYLS